MHTDRKEGALNRSVFLETVKQFHNDASNAGFCDDQLLKLFFFLIINTAWILVLFSPDLAFQHLE